MSQRVVALFVRVPLPGRVKTRLAVHLGDEGACRLYRAMVADLLQNLPACGLPLYLFHDGSDALEVPVAWVQASTKVVVQSTGDIGARMAAAFAHCFAEGIKEVILVGSDLPGLSARMITAAAAALQDHDVAIAPAADGGYGLIALKETTYQPALFQEIPWSTDQVLRSTVAKCEERHLRLALLDVLQDIDTIDDLKAYGQKIAPHAVETNRYLQEKGLY